MKWKLKEKKKIKLKGRGKKTMHEKLIMCENKKKFKVGYYTEMSFWKDLLSFGME